jgi:iron complex outermembrane receptor protein
MPKKILLFFTLTMFCNILFSQNTVSGKILSQQLEILSGAHIHMGRNTVSSDYNGNYTLSNLPSGPIKVNISFVGYKPVDTIINLQSDLKIDFKLKHI